MRADTERLWERLQECNPGRLNYRHTVGTNEWKEMSKWLEASIDEIEAERLLGQGQCKDGISAKMHKSTILEEGGRREKCFFEPGRCHHNSIKLAKARSTFRFCSGLAQGVTDDPKDDIWRVHSWVEGSDGTIHETCSASENRQSLLAR